MLGFEFSWHSTRSDQSKLPCNAAKFALSIEGEDGTFTRFHALYCTDKLAAFIRGSYSRFRVTHCRWLPRVFVLTHTRIALVVAPGGMVTCRSLVYLNPEYGDPYQDTSFLARSKFRLQSGLSV